jgi:hypothetical protein
MVVDLLWLDAVRLRAADDTAGGMLLRAGLEEVPGGGTTR